MVLANTPVLAKALTENKVDSRFANLVSDDLHPYTIVEEGHLDRILRVAVACGIPAVRAIQMVTINAATCFRMDRGLVDCTTFQFVPLEV